MKAGGYHQEQETSPARGTTREAGSDTALHKEESQ
jgi:hypothetical protein